MSASGENKPCLIGKKHKFPIVGGTRPSAFKVEEGKRKKTKKREKNKPIYQL